MRDVLCGYGLCFLMLGCRTDAPADKDTDSSETLAPPIADIFVDTLGAPIPALQSTLFDAYDNGKRVMSHSFTPNTGLGPTFNADSCAGCHQMPVAGGSAPRYRDFWLIQEVRWDGALVNAGTNGESPVRNLYATPPTFHVPPSPDATTYARRNTPPMFGVGLFAFVDDADILALADPEDLDGDGISGRPNYEKGEIGRFGYKSQAASLESFNRGAIFNQMGITSDPLFYEFLELQDTGSNHQHSFWNHLELWNPINTAEAQVSALDEPTVDDDLAPDPEISNTDQQDLLIFSTYIGVPRPTPSSERTTSSKEGETLFTEIGCTDCHLPTLPSKIGHLPAYTDLLLHDMGEQLADGITAGFATGQEFRTQPLWGVGLHPPYLHDGRADTLQEAIEWHGGEASHSVDGWLALTTAEQTSILEFLHDLGAVPNQQNFLNDSADQTPTYGEVGGPRRELSSEEQALFERGRALFDTNLIEKGGLSPMFNADSCRACHQDPVLGGAGGLDVNVLRMGWMNQSETSVLPRSTLPNTLPTELIDWDTSSDTDTFLANTIIEARQPPSLLGLGEIEYISDSTILANEDPNDENGDGISGRAYRLEYGRIGRFGWKAQIPTVQDFVADALLQEIGVTVHPSLSDFTIAEDFDSCEDPEFIDEDVEALRFFVYELAPPASQTSEVHPLFHQVGCDSCHTPSLDNVPLFSDLLLHDMGYPDTTVVDHDPFALASEYRTPPLWGIKDTAPYMHDGSAETLHEAILQHSNGGAGEAFWSIEQYQALSTNDRQDLLRFLDSL